MRVFVHPFYDRSNKEEDAEKIKRIESGIERTLQSESLPPTFIFEDRANLDKLKEIINYDKGRPIRIIPTAENNATPDLIKDKTLGSYTGMELFGSMWEENKDMPYYLKEEFEGMRAHMEINMRWNWQALIGFLKEIGVKKMIVGGRDLELFDPKVDISTNPALYNCVGDALQHLQPHFDAEISNLAYPKSRKDFKK
ncbi:MAG: hypothetical protein NT094_01825 [Candidatus Staskawiczbacteria bacterium]|nr:hypothetical protein [Candidatus Staskawiczbacteria bacterium]